MIHVTARVHPFAPAQREVREFPAGSTIHDIVTALVPVEVGRVIVMVDGEECTDRDTAPADDSLVTVSVVPAGSDMDMEDASKKTIGWGLVLGLGIMFVGLVTLNPWVALAGASVVVGGIATGAQLYKLSKALDIPGSESTLSIAGGRNTISPWGKVPVVIGKHRLSPHYAAGAYTYVSGTDGEDQYLKQIFCLGRNTLKVSDIKLGENLLASNSADVRNGNIAIDGAYSDVFVELYQNGTAPSEYDKLVTQDEIGAALTYNNAVWRTSAKNTTQLVAAINVAGLYKVNNGDRVDHTVVVEARYRVAGSGTAWASCPVLGTLNITRARAKLLRYELAKTVAEGQYEVGLMRTSADDPEDFDGASETTWAALRSHRNIPVVSASMRSKVVLLAVAIKATDQLNGAIDNLNCICESVEHIYAGSNWTSTAVSRNPASHLIEGLVHGRFLNDPIPSASIDWAAFNAWYTLCASKGWNCDKVLADSATLQDLCNRIAHTGRAYITLRDGLYSVVVDEARTTPVQHFTPRNVRSFTWTKAFGDLPHGYRLGFLSADDDYQTSERLCLYDEYTEGTATKLERLDLWGITDAAQVWKHGRYLLACRRLRPEAYTFETDVEGIVCEPGDLVLVSHDSIAVGIVSGRVKALTLGAGGIVTGVEIDEEIEVEAGVSYGVQIRAVGGYYYRTVTVDGRELTLSSSIPAGVLATGDLYTIGEAGTETMRCVVSSIEAGQDFGCRISCLDEAPGVHTADSGTIPTYTPLIGRKGQDTAIDTDIDSQLVDLRGQITDRPTASTLSTAPATPASLTARAVQDGITLLAAPGGSPGLDNSAAYYHYQVSRDGGLTWPGDWTAAAQAEFRFDRDVDGYPDSVSLYRARVKAVSAAGVESVSWLTVAVDGTGYVGWTPATPGLSGSCAGRMASMRATRSGNYYGHAGIDIQIQRDGDGANWYAQGDEAQAYTSETAYRSGAAGGYSSTIQDTFTQRLPLKNQDVNLPEDTTYLYRVRAVVAKPTTANPNARAVSAWSAARSVIALPVGVRDIVEKAIKTAQLDDLAVESGKLGPGAVLTEKLADAAVEVSKIKDAAVEAAKIKDGAVVMDKIAANAVVASKLAVGDPSNMILNPSGEFASDPWNFCAAQSDDGYYLKRAQGARDSVYGVYMPVEPGQKYYCSFEAKATEYLGTKNHLRIILFGQNAEKTAYYYPQGTGWIDGALDNVWVKATGVFTIPANMYWMRLGTQVDGTSGNSTEIGPWKIRNVELRRQNGTTLIEDGAITTSKIYAEAVTADQIAANAVTADKIEAQAITAEKLHVLAKNLVNDLTDDADGTTGWNTAFNRALDESLSPAYMVGRIPTVARAASDSFTVGPNDIIELEYNLRAPGAATTGEAYVGTLSDTSELYELSTWDDTAKAWGAFSGNQYQYILHGSAAPLNTSYKRLLSYVVGINVQPDAIPAPVNGLASTTYCVRTKSGVARMSVVNRAGTGDLYFFAPSARKVGAGKITAPQIITKNLAAINAKLGEIQGDTADYKLVMGSGGSAEEGTLLLGATTDASYFRRWKEGGVWKMAIKLATLFVDAVSSKILGIFRVRNSADTATVFEVDPVNGISSLINHKFPVGAEYNGSCKHHKYAGKNYSTVIYIHIARMRYSTTATYDLVKIALSGGRWTGYKTAMDVYLTAREGVKGRYIGTIENVTVEVWDNGTKYDVWMKIAGTYSTATAEVTINDSPDMELGSGGVTSTPAGTLVWSSGAAADRVSLDLAAVTANSLDVSGAVSAGSASVAGNALVGSLNGATPGGGGLELLQQQALGDGWAEMIAESVRLSGIAQDGSSASFSFTTPSLGRSTSSLVFCYTNPNFLEAYSWNGTIFSKTGATDSSFSSMRRKIAVKGNTVVIASEGTRVIYCRQWNGSSFQALPNGPTLSGSNWHVAVCELYTRGVGRIGFTAYAFADSSTGTIKVYEVGSNYSQHDLGWNLIHTQSITGISSGRCELARISDNTIALFNYGQKRIEIYNWTGVTLVSGPTLSFPSASGENALTAFSSGVLGFHECATNTFHTVAYSGTALDIIDSSTLSVGSSVGIAAVSPAQMALASSSGFLRMYKRTPGGVPRVTREFTQWGPNYSLAFEPGTTYAHIYTTITSIQGTSDKYWGVYGNYGTGALCVMRCNTSAVYFYNNVGAGQLTATKDSSTAIAHRLVVGFTV